MSKNKKTEEKKKWNELVPSELHINPNYSKKEIGKMIKEANKEARKIEKEIFGKKNK